MARTNYATVAEVMDGMPDVVKFVWAHNYRGIEALYPAEQARGRDLVAGESVWYSIPATLYGDYAGNGALGRANSKVILDEFSDDDVMDYDYGSYGTHVVLARGDSTNQELISLIAALFDYPVVDDNALSEQEHEEQMETWENHIASDFRRGLVSKLEDMSENAEADPSMYDDADPYVDSLSDDALYELFRNAADASNTYWEQDGDSQWINVDRVLEGVDDVALWQAFDDWHHHYGSGKGKMPNPRRRRAIRRRR